MYYFAGLEGKKKAPKAAKLGGKWASTLPYFSANFKFKRSLFKRDPRTTAGLNEMEALIRSAASSLGISQDQLADTLNKFQNGRIQWPYAPENYQALVAGAVDIGTRYPTAAGSLGPLFKRGAPNVLKPLDFAQTVDSVLTSAASAAQGQFVIGAPEQMVDHEAIAQQQAAAFQQQFTPQQQYVDIEGAKAKQQELTEFGFAVAYTNKQNALQRNVYSVGEGVSAFLTVARDPMSGKWKMTPSAVDPGRYAMTLPAPNEEAVAYSVANQGGIKAPVFSPQYMGPSNQDKPPVPEPNKQQQTVPPDDGIKAEIVNLSEPAQGYSQPSLRPIAAEGYGYAPLREDYSQALKGMAAVEAAAIAPADPWSAAASSVVSLAPMLMTMFQKKKKDKPKGPSKAELEMMARQDAQARKEKYIKYGLVGVGVLVLGFVGYKLYKRKKK